MDLRAAALLATELLAEHGLDDWEFRFDRAKRRAGVCNYASRTISISAPLTRLHDEHEVRETLLHEIAHALAGPTAGHGPAWRRIALRIGSSAERCLATDVPSVPGDWVGVCPAGHTIERHRRPRRVVTCKQCSPTFDLGSLFDWTHQGMPAPMLPSYLAELARLRTGRPTAVAGLGAQVVITTSGRYAGLAGQIVKRTRSNYHVQTDQHLLRVPHGGVDVVDGR